MSELIGDSVVSGIARELDSKFSALEFKAIYKNKPKQGMLLPCAFIHQIDNTQTNEMTIYSRRNYLVDVRVHPPITEGSAYTWLREIAEKLTWSLKTIQVGDKPLKYSNIETKIQDDVLHCILSYSFRVVDKIEEAESMKNISHTERVK